MIIKGPNILINNTFFEPSLIRAEKAISKALEVHIACARMNLHHDFRESI